MPRPRLLRRPRAEPCALRSPRRRRRWIPGPTRPRSSRPARSSRLSSTSIRPHRGSVPASHRRGSWRTTARHGRSRFARVSSSMMEALSTRPPSPRASSAEERRAPLARSSATPPRSCGAPTPGVGPREDAALASLGIDAAATPFDRAEPRRAVAMAVNRNALAAVYAGTSRPATQVVPPGSLGYDDSVVEFAALDVDAARKALADAHVPTPVPVDLAYPNVSTTAYPDPQRIAQSIAADLAKIGVVARLRPVEPSALRASGATFTLDATALGLDPDDVFWPLYGLDDPSGASLIVGLVRKARAEADPTKRAELYKQVSKIARTDALRVPLLFADKPNATTARLVGYSGIEYFGTVWLRP